MRHSADGRYHAAIQDFQTKGRPGVRRDELPELHYITPIENVPSIAKHGILSHRRTRRVRHATVAMQAIQDRRAKVRVPNGLPLHEYANLYICARNPMLFKRQAAWDSLCVLRVSTGVLDIAGAIVTDQNAASDYARFMPAPGGLRLVHREMTFADDWRHPNPIEYFRRKAAKCAELLVPNSVPPGYLEAAYVANDDVVRRFAALECGLAATVNSRLFFA